MGIDYSRFAIPKGPLHVEVQRAKRLTEAQAERACRSAVRKRDRGRCVVPGCKEKATALHHVVYRSQSKALKFSPSNVSTMRSSTPDGSRSAGTRIGGYGSAVPRRI
jgi:hypothetical protein